MTTTSVTTAQVGTKLSTGADTKITGITMTQPSATADLLTPLTLVDAAAAPTATSGFQRSIYSAFLSALSFVFWYKPGMTLSVGLTAPVWPQAIVTNGSLGFTSGIFVASCPAGVTFSITSAP